ncbi:hypothetical protein V6N11_065003 [Hibiscus sabdariffa]|uniref:Uncharacterized protein n=1 Tax=Hibiscus sabdariffa TaxID=183260 RepID=A0ABR2SIJ5_9ROSI
MVFNIANFYKAATYWNENIFGHIGKRKRQLMAHISGIERVVDFSTNNHLQELEKKLKGDLDVVLWQEESLWFQRSRSQWIEDGDRNTKYYQKSY